MNRELFEFHKLASITILTGRTGAGKSTLAERLVPQYDKVFQTDFERPMNPRTGKYHEPTQEEKGNIRSKKLNEILRANKRNLSILVEGHPPGVVKLLKGHLGQAEKIMLLPISEEESFKRVESRAKADPQERSVAIDRESATVANGEYEKYLKKLEASGVPIELVKTAAAEAPSTPHQEKLDSHFSSHEKTRWRDFRRNLRSQSFVDALKFDDRADPKLKRFAVMIGKHHASKDPGIPVVGDQGLTYRVKFHEDIGRFSCGCNDWIYNHSHKGKGDCKHIIKVRSALEKQADIRPLVRGVRALQVYSTHKDEEAKARIANTAYKQNMPRRFR